MWRAAGGCGTLPQRRREGVNADKAWLNYWMTANSSSSYEQHQQQWVDEWERTCMLVWAVIAVGRVGSCWRPRNAAKQMRENKRQVNEAVVDICSSGRAEVRGEETAVLRGNIQHTGRRSRGWTGPGRTARVQQPYQQVAQWFSVLMSVGDADIDRCCCCCCCCWAQHVICTLYNTSQIGCRYH